PTSHQQHVTRDDVCVGQADLLRAPIGTVTRAGFDNNVEVCVRYLAAWLDGNGCVPIHWLMEDAATAEIARTQLWQWLHHERIATAAGDPAAGPPPLDVAEPIDSALLDRALTGLPGRLAARMTLPGASRTNEAIGMLVRLCGAAVLA